jgi:hypothetical protein
MSLNKEKLKEKNNLPFAFKNSKKPFLKKKIKRNVNNIPK